MRVAPEVDTVDRYAGTRTIRISPDDERFIGGTGSGLGAD
jgi:hypothetical protein